LKHDTPQIDLWVCQSPAARGRGLKRAQMDEINGLVLVARRARAWIETLGHRLAESAS